MSDNDGIVGVITLLGFTGLYVVVTGVVVVTVYVTGLDFQSLLTGQSGDVTVAFVVVWGAGGVIILILWVVVVYRGYVSVTGGPSSSAGQSGRRGR